MQSEQINELAAALAKAQGQMKNAIFNRTNPHYRHSYADLASIIDAIRKPLTDNNIAFPQTTFIRDNMLIVETKLIHSSGQWISSEFPVVIGKPQQMGSEITYAKRYSLAAITGVAAEEDDDAEAASNTTRHIPKAAPKPREVVNPETGEVTVPTAQDKYVALGGMLVTAVKLAQDDAAIERWMNDNNAQLWELKEHAPKIYDRVMARVEEKRAELQKKDAA